MLKYHKILRIDCAKASSNCREKILWDHYLSRVQITCQKHTYFFIVKLVKTISRLEGKSNEIVPILKLIIYYAEKH